MTTKKTLWSLAVAGAMFTAACGDSKSSMNPVAPTAVVVDGSQSDESGGVFTKTAKGGNGNGNSGNAGNGNGNGNSGNTPGNGNSGNGNGNQPSLPGGTQTSTNTTPTTTRKVEIEGLIFAKSGDGITVNGQDVTVPTTCVIRHGNTQFTFADLHVGDRVHVKGMRTTTGTGLTATTKIEASEVKLQNPGDGDDDDDGEGPTSMVSVSAPDALADETGSNAGSFRLTRTGDATTLASPLSVSFTLTGTATNGTDYTSIPLTANFLANQTTVDVAVTPTADGTTEGAESVILTLTTVPAPYELGSPATATVTITDTSNPLVSVTAFDSTATEPASGAPPSDMGTFRFTRTGSTAASLTVTIALSGAATNGVDYQNLSTTVTFGAGQSTVDVFVVPLSDAAAEGSEGVTVTVSSGSGYDVGAPATATVNIAG